MRTLSQITRVAAPLVLVVICSYGLWDMSEVYAGESETRLMLQEYVMQEAPELIEQPQPSGQPLQPLPVQQAETIPDIEEQPITVPAETINPLIQSLQDNVNRDITAWLRIPGTNIDYPVVSASDNEFYLQRDVYGNTSRAGSLFTDCRCAQDFSGFYAIIYGHNMKNRSMFGNLRLYADPDFFDENRYGTLLTGTDTYFLEIFAYMVINSDDPMIYANPPSAEDFFAYIKENARVYREPESKEKVITLSTCAYEFEGARIVVLAAAKGSRQ